MESEITTMQQVKILESCSQSNLIKTAEIEKVMIKQIESEREAKWVEKIKEEMYADMYDKWLKSSSCEIKNTILHIDNVYSYEGNEKSKPVWNDKWLEWFAKWETEWEKSFNAEIDAKYYY